MTQALTKIQDELISCNANLRNRYADNLKFLIIQLRNDVTDRELTLLQNNEQFPLTRAEQSIKAEMKRISDALKHIRVAEILLRTCDIPGRPRPQEDDNKRLLYAQKFVGKTVGNWVIKNVIVNPDDRSEGIYYLAKCGNCGNDAVVLAKNVRNGQSKTCGCSRKQKRRKY